MKHSVVEISRATLNLIFPIYCQGCGIKLSYNNKFYLCNRCLINIRPNKPPFCIRCGRPLMGDKDTRAACPSCLNKSYSFERAWQCCEYDGLLKELVKKFKYNRKLFLRHILVEILYNFTSEYIDYRAIDGITAVPMHRSNLYKRRFNQTSLLSGGLAERLGIPYYEDCLLKIKRTKQQVLLKKDERFSNVKGSFAVKDPKGVARKRILLIDDVFTTGSTVEACSKTLVDADVGSVWVLTLAGGI